MPTTRKSTDYKLTAVQHYLVEDISQGCNAMGQSI